MIHVPEILEMHRDTVVRWHDQEIDNPYQDLLAVACKQHSFNFLLWHEEDIARATDVPDSKIAEVKRAIDGYNQQRNDWIEKLDDWISEQLAAQDVSAPAEAPLNTETPGSVIDRLSILALRIYHLEEQAQRDDASPEHVAGVERKIAVCLAQCDDLAASLQQLSDDIFAGRKRHRTYRQFKMYNDPTLNPYLYRAQTRLGRD